MEEKERRRASAPASKSTKTGKSTGTKRKTTKKKSRKKRARVIRNRRIALAAVGILLLILAVFFGVRSCGVSHHSPESVVKDMITACGKGKAKRARSCYMPSEKEDEALQQEIDATISYIKAHNPQKLTIDRCGILAETEKETYVYIIYGLELENGQVYPCLSSYVTGQDGKKYYIYPPSQVTEAMSEKAVTEYARFMTSDIYKDYMTSYETFIKKNPGYEDRISGKLQ